jgi:hypothetical protein
VPGGFALSGFCFCAAMTHGSSALTHVWPDDHFLVSCAACPGCPNPELVLPRVNHLGHGKGGCRVGLLQTTSVGARGHAGSVATVSCVQGGMSSLHLVEAIVITVPPLQGRLCLGKKEGLRRSPGCQVVVNCWPLTNPRQS